MSLRESPAWQIYQELKPPSFPAEKLAARWPEGHVPDPDGQPTPFHIGQHYAYEADTRIVAMVAGSQGGKTGFGPQVLWKWIRTYGGGDWFAVTSTYDLFKLKMLPALLHLFVERLGIARYWAGDRMLELADPATGLFHARISADPMWGRVILRSADSKGGLEAGTGKGAWLDEAGQDKFDLAAWKAIKRRLALSQGPILLTTTLYELGWVDSKIIDVAQSGGDSQVEYIEDRGELELTSNRHAGITLVQFDSPINPLYPKEEYEAARREMPDDEFQAFFRGRRVASRLMVFDCFDRQRNTCPRFAVPQDWPRYLGVDFGGVNTAAVHLAERPGDRTLFAYREYLAGSRTASEHAARLIQGEPGLKAAYGGSPSEQQWRDEFRAGGLSMRGPMTGDFDVGLQRVYAQLKSGGLVIFDDLTGLLGQIQKYRRKRDRQGNVLDEVENKNQFHFIDAIRYPIVTLRPGRRPKAKVVRLG